MSPELIFGGIVVAVVGIWLSYYTYKDRSHYMDKSDS